MRWAVVFVVLGLAVATPDVELKVGEQVVSLGHQEVEMRTPSSVVHATSHGLEPKDEKGHDLGDSDQYSDELGDDDEEPGAHPPPPSELRETTTAANPQSDDTASRQATGKLGETVSRKGRRSSYHSRSARRRRKNRRRGHNPGHLKVAEASVVFQCPAGFKDVTNRKETKYWAPIPGLSSAQLMIETRECQCRCSANKLCTHDGKRSAHSPHRIPPFCEGA